MVSGGDALSEPLLLASGLACLLTAAVMGVVGYRLGREEGRGLWSSVRRGVRMVLRAALDLVSLAEVGARVSAVGA